MSDIEEDAEAQRSDVSECQLKQLVSGKLGLEPMLSEVRPLALQSLHPYRPLQTPRQPSGSS